MAQGVGDLVRDIVASPLGDVIASVGEGVAAAQQALDDASLAKTLEIYSEAGAEAHALLREIGYRPTFYVLPETTGEVHVSLSLGSQPPKPASRATAVSVSLSRIGRTLGVAPKLYATPVDAAFASRYGYQANISAKLTFKIVPVPPPSGTEDLRIMPNLVGLATTAAKEALARLGLSARFADAEGIEMEAPAAEAMVTAQVPAPDTILRVGHVVTLTVAA